MNLNATLYYNKSNNENINQQFKTSIFNVKSTAIKLQWKTYLHGF